MTILTDEHFRVIHVPGTTLCEYHVSPLMERVFHRAGHDTRMAQLDVAFYAAAADDAAAWMLILLEMGERLEHLAAEESLQ